MPEDRTGDNINDTLGGEIKTTIDTFAFQKVRLSFREIKLRIKWLKSRALKLSAVFSRLSPLNDPSEKFVLFVNNARQ